MQAVFTQAFRHLFAISDAPPGGSAVFTFMLDPEGKLPLDLPNAPHAV
jgi:hypothetical protein